MIKSVTIDAVELDRVTINVASEIETEVNPWDLLEWALSQSVFPKGVGRFIKNYFDEALENEGVDVWSTDTAVKRIRDLAVYIDALSDEDIMRVVADTA